MRYLFINYIIEKARELKYGQMGLSITENGIVTKLVHIFINIIRRTW